MARMKFHESSDTSECCLNWIRPFRAYASIAFLRAQYQILFQTIDLEEKLLFSALDHNSWIPGSVQAHEWFSIASQWQENQKYCWKEVFLWSKFPISKTPNSRFCHSSRGPTYIGFCSKPSTISIYTSLSLVDWWFWPPRLKDESAGCVIHL